MEADKTIRSSFPWIINDKYRSTPGGGRVHDVRGIAGDMIPHDDAFIEIDSRRSPAEPYGCEWPPRETHCLSIDY
jgi:hypothetical protein